MPEHGEKHMDKTLTDKTKSKENVSDYVTVGLLAHVDAGKTTLAESMLYQTGSIRRQGRVDHGDAYLDTFEIEKNRGITVFSKQAQIQLGEKKVTLLDTPGHMDFSAEMERTLQVLDYAVLIISAADGISGHTLTLWKLLDRYHIPVFIFVNKMDQPGADKEGLMQEIKRKLGDACLDFTVDLEHDNPSDFYEELAMCDEAALETFLESGCVAQNDIVRMIRQRKVFPCYFGSALKMQKTEALLKGMETYMVCANAPEQFGARVYKITRDAQGARLTHLKITGGILHVKDLLENEKVDQIRIYSGASYKTTDEAVSGMICAVTGPENTWAGQGIGTETEIKAPLLVPVLNYRLWLPQGGDMHQVLSNLRQLEEEEPQLHVVWDETLGEIYVQLMGEVQIEILKTMMQDRFGTEVAFDAGHIVYKETIGDVTEGVGHFEPLRHYAEVHLLMSPGEPGSGLVFESTCSTDALDLNWQRLILTHLEEKQHLGVLTGSPITDMKITLAAGRAHLKHTEGGDFRQATYRAVRQGLMSAQNILLEPVYTYRLEVPQAMVGRAMTDLGQMHGTVSAPVLEGDMAVLEGTVPVVTIRGYQTEVLAYTKGCGHLMCEFKGYEPCHNTEEVIADIAYDAQADTQNTADSVFCAHGAGFIVPWHEVPKYMHLESCLKLEDTSEDTQNENSGRSGYQPKQRIATDEQPLLGEEEIESLFNQTLSANINKKKNWNYSTGTTHASGKSGKYASGSTVYNTQKSAPVPPKHKYLLVDGYNIIFAWEELSTLAKADLHSARTKLMDILCNYQGYTKVTLILVFDAYKVEGGQGSVSKYRNIHVVYTKEAETADQYIEKTVHEIGKKYDVTVATSDGLEQVIIMGQGAKRLSASELQKDIEEKQQQMRKEHLNKTPQMANYLLENASEEIHAMVHEIRKGKR